MAAKEIGVKKYVVRLSGDEREQLATLIRKGKNPARRLMKARILLKTDVAEAAEGWSDNQIIEALETSASMVYRACITKPHPQITWGILAKERNLIRIDCPSSEFLGQGAA